MKGRPVPQALQDQRAIKAMQASPGRLVRPAQQVRPARPVQSGLKVPKVPEANGDPRDQRAILEIRLKDQATN